MLKIVVTVVMLIGLSAGFKVLLVFPFPYKSHGILGAGFVRHLIDAGHEVTYVTPFPLSSTNSKLHQVKVENYGVLDATFNIKTLLEGNLRSDPWKIFKVMVNAASNVLADKNVRHLLNDRALQYDLVIAEWMNTEIYSGFSAVFDCPYIWFFPYDQYLEIFRLIHTPSSAAYTPNIRTKNIPPFNFAQRVQELWYQIVTLYTRNFKYSTIEESVYKQHFEDVVRKRGRQLQRYNQIKYNASLAFSNSHISLRDTPELPPALKMIGGFHIETPIKKLPKNLQKAMDKSTNGVILFSMGTQLTRGGMPTELVNELLKAFSNLPYTVLWRSDEEINDLPDNIIVQAWIPQLSVLAHPNCVLFITHGGLLSMTESVYNGVPIIGIPVFVDQFINVDTAVKNGYGRKVELSFTMANSLREEINRILNDSNYARRAKEMSLVYHDRPVHPGAELVHWVEHVVKTRGALHLRSPALHVPLYQKLFLDIVAAAVLVLIFGLVSYKYLIKIPFHKLVH